MSAHTSSARLKVALAAAAVLSATLPTLAAAQARPSSTPARNDAARVWRTLSVDAPPIGAQRVVMPCQQGAVARRNFERRFGQQPVFITADQALSARNAGESWTAPRCMTWRELDRLSERLD
jgi:hypothetical protein